MRGRSNGKQACSDNMQLIKSSHLKCHSMLILLINQCFAVENIYGNPDNKTNVISYSSVGIKVKLSEGFERVIIMYVHGIDALLAKHKQPSYLLAVPRTIEGKNNVWQCKNRLAYDEIFSLTI